MSNIKLTIHCVIPDRNGDLFDFHTHGLESVGQKELQILAPAFCRGIATTILRAHADAAEQGERFMPGEFGELEGMVVQYVEVSADAVEDPTRLRIVDAVATCQCDHCRCKPINTN